MLHVAQSIPGYLWQIEIGRVEDAQNGFSSWCEGVRQSEWLGGGIKIIWGFRLLETTMVVWWPAGTYGYSVVMLLGCRWCHRPEKISLLSPLGLWVPAHTQQCGVAKLSSDRESFTGEPVAHIEGLENLPTNIQWAFTSLDFLVLLLKSQADGSQMCLYWCGHLRCLLKRVHRCIPPLAITEDQQQMFIILCGCLDACIK